MKKIRSCPFGYRMENGTYTVVPEERRLIEQIFTRYLDGASLQQLSIMAEETGLKFRENASSWNKNMVSRILDNSRYWDGEQYPPIVEREIATKVADLKQSKASPRSQTPFIQKRMTCPYCGSRLKRNGKKPHRTFWDCKCCQQRLGPIPDDTLLQVVSERFLAVCLNPHIVEPVKESAESLSIQAARLTNEINQAMNQREVEPNELLLLILECAAEKYKTCSIKEADHLTITLKALFQAHSNDTTLDRKLFERAVKQVILQPDASVQLRLLNDTLVYRVIERVTVLSKEEIRIRFVGGFEITQPLH